MSGLSRAAVRQSATERSTGADELDDAPPNGRAPSAGMGDPFAWIEV